MESLQKAVREDLKAAIEAFRNDSFDDTNIYANRIMANALFGDDVTLFLHGFFLKDVAHDFMMLKAKKEATAYSTAKSYGFKYIESLEKSFPSSDPGNLWKEFHEYSDGIRKFLMSDFEEKSYSNNVEFTQSAFSWLVKYLKEHKDVLLDPRNWLLEGVLNELDRIFRVHSGMLSEVALRSLIKALARCYEYSRRVYRTPTGQMDETRLKANVFSYIDSIEEIYSRGTKIDEVDEILRKLVKDWREFFIQYSEPRPARVQFEKGIELPPELKKKITESLSETLEKKL